MPINWSEQRAPNKECSYDHIVAETPLGELRLEWKGWKERDAPMATMPWGEFIIGNDLEEAKQSVQTAWNKMAARVISQSTDR